MRSGEEEIAGRALSLFFDYIYTHMTLLLMLLLLALLRSLIFTHISLLFTVVVVVAAATARGLTD